jgi:leucyl aminopeptidase
MIGLKAVDLQKQKIETLVVPVCEDKEIHDDRIIRRVTQKAVKLKEFKAEKGDRITLYDFKGLATERIICAGLGKLKKIDHEVLRSFCGAVVDRCMQAGFEKIWVAVPAAKKLKMEMPPKSLFRSRLRYAVTNALFNIIDLQ